MKSIVLVILDGWGIGHKNETNPIHTAQPKTINYIEKNFPAGALNASGVTVGLPWEEPGNSEVGHLTLGAGRVLYQHFLRITKSIESGEFFDKKALKQAFTHAKKNDTNVHLVGLLSDGNVHAAIEHLQALIKMAAREGVEDRVYLQLFSDGKDSDPRSVKDLLAEVKKTTNNEGVGYLSTIIGRYWAMNREGDWDKTKTTYDLLTGEVPGRTLDESIKRAYNKDLNDTYLEPAKLDSPTPIKDGDSVIFFNFREDGMKQIAAPFVQKDFGEFETKNLQGLFVASMTKYNKNIPTEVAFPPLKIENTLGEVFANKGQTQLRVAESMKGAHVTYFFNGLKQKELEGEFRVILPSPKVGRIDEAPEMRAEDITNRVQISLQEGGFNFILANYANPDVIAHTGNYNATVKAIQILDKELERLVQSALSGNHTLIITSDHGNAESLFDRGTGRSETKHNVNPVPFYIVDNKFKKSDLGAPGKLPNIGILSDVAPTILDLADIQPPSEMTGNSLLDLI